MVYIGYNYEGKVVSIVNAKSKELAYAYWQGKSIIPHSHKCLEKDFTSLDEHPTGVFPIVETEEVDDYALSQNTRLPRGRKYLLIK